MTKYERLHLAMAHKKADRVPVMCQLSFEHMEKNSGVKPIDMYYSAEGFAQAFLNMRELYQFDGILLDAWIKYDWKEKYDKIRRTKIAGGEEYVLHDGRVFRQEGQLFHEIHTRKHAWERPEQPSIEDIDVDSIFKRGFEGVYVDDMALHEIVVAEGKKGKFSVHGETNSPFDFICFLLGLENALMALLTEPMKCKELLDGYVAQSFALAKAQIDVGVDTMKISSPFVGGSFISLHCYEEFVVPYERALVQRINAYAPGMPIYTHTCGFIGDRLAQMQSTGIDGIECMDPPPLGDTELADAKQQVGNSLFLKGNMDSVNVLLGATPEIMESYVKKMIADGARGGGYILSSACSVAPDVSAEVLKMLVPLVEKYGVYGEGGLA